LLTLMSLLTDLVKRARAAQRPHPGNKPWY
jgi:hypothetical protein